MIPLIIQVLFESLSAGEISFAFEAAELGNVDTGSEML